MCTCVYPPKRRTRWPAGEWTGQMHAAYGRRSSIEIELLCPHRAYVLAWHLAAPLFPPMRWVPAPPSVIGRPTTSRPIEDGYSVGIMESGRKPIGISTCDDGALLSVVCTGEHTTPNLQGRAVDYILLFSRNCAHCVLTQLCVLLCRAAWTTLLFSHRVQTRF